MSTSTDPSFVAAISEFRQRVVPLIEDVERILDYMAKNRHPAGRELALVRTKLQEARMWGGQALSHFDTGFKPSDQPDDPETHSKGQ